MDGKIILSEKKIDVLSFSLRTIFIGNSDDPRDSKDKSSTELGQTLSRMERNTHKFVRWHSKETKKVEALNYEYFVEERRKYSPWKTEPSTNRKFYHFIWFFFCRTFFMKFHFS